MTLPLPSLLLSRGVVQLGDFVFNIRIGTLSVFSVITTVSFVVLLAQTYDLQKRYAMHSDPHLEVHYSADLQVGRSVTVGKRATVGERIGTGKGLN